MVFGKYYPVNMVWASRTPNPLNPPEWAYCARAGGAIECLQNCSLWGRCDFLQTAVSCETKGRELVFRIGPREGAFNGMPSSHRVTLRIHGKNAMAQPIDLGEVNALEGVTHRTIRQ